MGLARRVANQTGIAFGLAASVETGTRYGERNRLVLLTSTILEKNYEYVDIYV